MESCSRLILFTVDGGADDKFGDKITGEITGVLTGFLGMGNHLRILECN
ncbi:MAG: hypothetical protein WA421_18220 [Nitrososphaeraceae archaeon]